MLRAPAKEQFNLVLCDVQNDAQADTPRLNLANADEWTYVQMLGGHKLCADIVNEQPNDPSC